MNRENECFEKVVEDMEITVISNIEKEMKACPNRDSLNKIYRHARIWVRIHCHFAKACSVEHAQELNLLFKQMRKGFLQKLED